MKRDRTMLGLMIGLLLSAGWVSCVQALTTTATNNGNWNVAANWDNDVPGAGCDAVIPSGRTITNTAPTASLNSFTNSGTLVFSGYDSTVTATFVTIAAGTVKHLPQSATTTNASGQWIPDNRVYFACSNLTVAPGAFIDGNGMGYAGVTGNVASLYGYGPGGGKTGDGGAGGSYGGAGTKGTASSALGPLYGSATMPDQPGSGGGAQSIADGWPGRDGGNGGGLVWIVANGTVTVNGTIRAEGTQCSSSNGGQGSGGGVYINCLAFAGAASGLVSVRGAPAPSSGGGGGGGGRLAIVYNLAAQSSQNALANLTANGGINAFFVADPGTIYLSDSSFIPTTVEGGLFMVQGLTNVALPNLTIQDGVVVSTASNRLTIATNLTVKAATANITAMLRVECADLTVGGNVVLTNSGGKISKLVVQAAPTNSPTPGYGSLVSVAGKLTIHSNSWFYPLADRTNGATVQVQVGNLAVYGGTNGGINADAGGYAGGFGTNTVSGYGPGKGTAAMSGGGYGGAGGGSGGGTYGSSNAPVQPGSGGAMQMLEDGGGRSGSSGGGLVRLEATGAILLDGLISADGEYCGSVPSTTDGHGSQMGGAGSGGGIYLKCKTFMGTANGKLSARGGNAQYQGSGGGGRIAVWRIFDVSGNLVSNSVDGGASGGPGFPGTVLWGRLPASGTIVSVR